MLTSQVMSLFDRPAPTATSITQLEKKPRNEGVRVAAMLLALRAHSPGSWALEVFSQRSAELGLLCRRRITYLGNQ